MSEQNDNIDPIDEPTPEVTPEVVNDDSPVEEVVEETSPGDERSDGSPEEEFEDDYDQDWDYDLDEEDDVPAAQPVGVEPVTVDNQADTPEEGEPLGSVHVYLPDGSPFSVPVFVAEQNCRTLVNTSAFHRHVGFSAAKSLARSAQEGALNIAIEGENVSFDTPAVVPDSSIIFNTSKGGGLIQ